MTSYHTGCLRNSRFSQLFTISAMNFRGEKTSSKESSRIYTTKCMHSLDFQMIATIYIYNSDGHPRIILSKTLTSSHKVRHSSGVELLINELYLKAHSIVCYKLSRGTYSRIATCEFLDS